MVKEGLDAYRLPKDVKVIRFIYRVGHSVTVDEVVLHPDGSWRNIPKGPQSDSRVGNTGRMFRRADGSDI